MKRTSFARPVYVRPLPSPLRRLERPVSVWQATDDVVLSIPKDNPLECEAYRRLVAALPCIHCGVEDQSQCAHGPAMGRGIKCDDRFSMPLCAARPGIPGCHYLFDQYMLGDAEWRRIAAIVWSARTRAAIVADGTWPGSLPMWEGA